MTPLGYEAAHRNEPTPEAATTCEICEREEVPIGGDLYEDGKCCAVALEYGGCYETDDDHYRIGYARLKADNERLRAVVEKVEECLDGYRV